MPVPTVLNAQAFGAKGDGVTDDGPAVLKMLDAAAKSKLPLTLQFAPNRSYFLKSGRNRYAFYFDGARNLTLDGGNSIFLVDSQQRFLKLIHSSNVAIHNFKVDYVPLPFAEGTVIARDKAAGTLDVRIDDGETLPPEGGATEEDGEQAYFGALWGPGTYNNQGEGGPYWVRYNLDIQNVSAPIANHVVRVQSKPIDFPIDDIKVGQWRFSIPVRGIAHRYGPGESFWLGDNTDLTLENIELWSAPWFAFGINGNRGHVTLRHVNVRPKPGTRHIASSWRDAFHVKNNRANVLFEDCVVQGSSDDAFNISSHTSKVREILSPPRIKISQNFPLGIAAMEVGDTLAFYSPIRGALIGRARITKVDVSPTNPGEIEAPLFTIDLDRNVEGLETENTLVWNETDSNPNTILRRCRMDTSCRFRSPVTLNSCQVNALAWFTGDEIETPLPSNVKVVNCQFRAGQGNPFISISMGGMFMEGHGPTEPVISNVLFAHNHIWGEFVLGDVRDLTLLDNDFADPISNVLMSNVINVRLLNNRHGDKTIVSADDIRGEATQHPEQLHF
ncbi:hypothetical protein IAD21_06323 [Abditibacteriota bacterium]|nr:hypothetical protein IAD21_06323 [Abditibacteriota bacterium]